MMFGWSSTTTRIALIATSTGILYLPSLALGFISDDYSLIELARASSVLSLFSGGVAGSYYRPLVQLSFLLDHSIWSVDYFGYHATNLVLHLSNTVFVCLIARRVLGDDSWGWVVCGVYFGLTPTHASSILWICGRTDLLCATFYLLSIWSYLSVRERGTPALVLSAASAFCALLCKEMALSIPLICFIASFALGRSDSWSRRARTAVVDSSPVFVVVFAYLALRLALFGSLPDSPIHETATPVMMLMNFSRYTAGLSIPIDLEVIKPFFRAHPPALIVACIALAALSLLLLRNFVRDRILLAIVVCTGICLVPVIRVFAPWYLYIPTLGTALVVGRLSDKLPRASLSRVWVRLSLVVLIGFHLAGLAQAMSWASTAGALAHDAIQTLKDSVGKGGRAVVVAIPSEYRGVPVFGWIGNLQYGVQLMDHPIQVDAIVGIRLSGLETQILADVDEAGDIHLAIAGDSDFFRLQDLSFLTGSSRPEAGQAYSTRQAVIKVEALNASGHPARLTLSPRSFSVSDPGVQVYAFVDGHLKQLGN